MPNTGALVPKRPTVRKLKQAPLVHTLAEVRFAAVLDMHERIIALQREFKKIGFPRYQVRQVPRIAITGGAPQIELAYQWRFSTANSRSAIVLANEFVSYSTSEYDTFEKFVPPFLEVCSHLASIGSVELVDRVGLRYIDLIRPSLKDPVTEYVKSELLGLPEAALESHAVRRTHVHTETHFATPYGTLLVRLRQLAPGAVLPDDIGPDVVLPNVRMESGEVAYALDCDHFRDQMSEGLGTELLQKTLWDLHSVASDAFKAAVTKHALEVWGPEEEVQT